MKLSNLYDILGYRRKRRKSPDGERERELKNREMQILSKTTVNMPTPSFVSNLEAPIPMRPNDRCVR